MEKVVIRVKKLITKIYKPTLFLLSLGFVFFIYHFSQAELDTLSQTDWSGGVGSLTATQYSSATNIDDSTAGEITLALNGEKFSNTGFENNLTGWSATETFNSKSLDVDGADEYIAVADTTDFTFGDGATDSPFSLSTWVYVDDYNGESFDVIAKFSSGATEYQLLIYGGTSALVGFNIYGSLGGTNYISKKSSSAITVGGWNHIVATYDASEVVGGMHVYINGSLDDGATAALNYANMSNGTSPLYMAGSLGALRYPDMKIDETAIWDKALSLSEVTEIYNSGVPTDLSSHSATANIISWWRMGEGYDYTLDQGAIFDQVGSHNGITNNTEVADAVDFVPGAQGAIVTNHNSITNNTLITHNGSLGSLRVVATSTSAYNVTQSINVGDTDTYNLVAYAYTDGSAITIADAELVVNGSTITTTYTAAGGGWYKLSGTTAGTASSIAYGVQVKASATIYLDDVSLYKNASSGTLTSNIFDTTASSQWGIVTFTTSGTGFATIRVRSDSSSDMSGAADFSTCSPIVSGQDISRNNCITDGDQYLQYQVYLSASDSSSAPVFEDFNVKYVINSSVEGATIALRVASYNTYVGLGADGSDKNNAIEKHINRVQPDILTLNEMNDAARSLISGGWAAALGYDYYTNATGGNSSQYNPSILSKYPILNSHYVLSAGGGNEMGILFLFTEIDISSLTTQKRLGVYSIHTSPICNVLPCIYPNASNSATEFERAIQFQRLATDITSTTSAYPTMEIIVMGDHNADTAKNQSESFASDPGGHTWAFTLGSDITFPVQYARFPEEQYGDINMSIVDAKLLDGEYYTISTPNPNPGFIIPMRIDYISVSDGLEIDGSEVLNSETDGVGGITKYNSVLTSGDSAVASDHNMVFADLAIVTDITPPVISLTALSPDPNTDNTPSLTGTATEASNTANTVSSVEFQMNGTGGSWTACSADDGAFDEAAEAFTCAVTATLSDGSHTIYIRATDSVSNTTTNGNASTDTFVIDTTVPVLSLTALSPDPTSSTTPVILGTATDATGTVTSVEFQMDGTGGSWTACTADDSTFDEAAEAFTCTTVTELSDGSHTIYIRTTDDASNTTTDLNASTDTFVIDTIAPSTPVASPISGLYPTNQSVDLLSQGSASIRYSTSTALTSCSAGTLYSTPISITSSQTVYTLGCDDAQNTASASFTYTLFDNTPKSFPAGWSTPPVALENGFNPIINSNKEVTSDRVIKLKLDAGQDVDRMIVSTQEDFSDTGIEKYDAEKEFDLCSEFSGFVKKETCLDGEYTVYIKYYTKYGVDSDVFSKKITLKSKQPNILPDTQEIIKSSAKLVKDLHFGFRDAQVLLLQKILNKIGFTVAKTGWGSIGNETDFFGNATSKALVKFQEANKDKQKQIFSEKGFVGPVTRELINSSENIGTSINTDIIANNSDVIKNNNNSISAIFTGPLTIGQTSKDITRLQTLLATNKNIYPQGIISGYFGTLTEKAVQAFQLKYGVVSSSSDVGFGYVGPKTREMLSKVFGQ